MAYNQDDESWDEYLSKEEIEDYTEKYHKSISAKLGAMPETEAEDVYNELRRTNYRPTGDWRSDSDHVLLKAKSTLRSKDDNVDKDVKALLGHIAKSDRTDVKTAERKYRKAMNDNSSDHRLAGSSIGIYNKDE